MSTSYHGSPLHMLATRLSVPYGPGTVSAGHIEAILRTGSFSALEETPRAEAIAHATFRKNRVKGVRVRIPERVIAPPVSISAIPVLAQPGFSGWSGSRHQGVFHFNAINQPGRCPCFVCLQRERVDGITGFFHFSCFNHVL